MHKKLPLREDFYEWYKKADEEIFRPFMGDDIAECEDTQEYVKATLVAFFRNGYGGPELYYFDVEPNFEIGEEVILYGEIKNFKIGCRSIVRKISPPSVSFFEVDNITERELIEEHFCKVTSAKQILEKRLFDVELGEYTLKMASRALSQWGVFFKVLDFVVEEKI